MAYRQLSYDDRVQIYILRKEGYSMRRIAKLLEVHPSTVSREIRRNTGQRGYRHKQAHALAVKRKRESRKHIRLTDALKLVIADRLRAGWSPEQISGRLRREGRAWVSHETIYQFIYADQRQGGDLYHYLRLRRKKRRKRLKSKGRRGRIRNAVSIDERPPIVDQKARIGDWELDTVFGKGRQGALVTMVERKTKMLVLAHVKAAKADLVADAIIQALWPYRHLVLTLTADNGKEFAFHQRIAQELQAQFFFAHPYAAWERGLNENTNGLIRQYFPKRQPLHSVPQNQLKETQMKLNTRPRKSLSFATPVELFYSSRVALGT